MKNQTLLGRLDDIDIRRLRVFRAVTESGGISAAELELNIGRSTISTHIKDLEIRLGVTLCRRGRAGFSLTEEGAHIYQATIQLLSSLDDFRAKVGDVHNRLTGQISLALFDKIVSNPEAQVANAFKQFDKLAPEVELSVYVESLNEIERGVMEGQFQIGIIPGHRMSSSLDYTPLFKEQMYLYCGREHPLFSVPEQSILKQDILNCKYAGLGYQSPNMLIGRRLGMKRNVTVYDQEAIAHLLLSGCYIGYLPDHYAKPFVEQGLIRMIGVEIFNYECEFFVITRRSPSPSRLVKTFLQCFVESHKVSY